MSANVRLGSDALCAAASTYGPLVATQGKQIAIELVPKAASAVAGWALENPALATGVIAGAAGITVVVAPGIVSLPVLSAVGFGPGGVAAGSTAAGVQGSIGNIAAGSFFSTLQSAAMGGYGAAIVNGGVQAGGAVITAAGGSLAWAKSKL